MIAIAYGIDAKRELSILYVGRSAAEARQKMEKATSGKKPKCVDTFLLQDPIPRKRISSRPNPEPVQPPAPAKADLETIPDFESQNAALAESLKALGVNIEPDDSPAVIQEKANSVAAAQEALKVKLEEASAADNRTADPVEDNKTDTPDSGDGGDALPE